MTIRLADETDASGIRAIYAPIVENTVISFEEVPPSESEMADRIADTLPRYPWLVREVGDQIAGYAYAGIALPNPASVALHESLGFEQVGVYESVGYKHGAWHDVSRWQLRLRERPENPQTPRTLDELGEDEDEREGRLESEAR